MGTGGQTLARLDQNGNAGSEDFPVGGADEVHRYNDGSLQWAHQQPLTGSRGESQSSTNYFGTEEPDSAGVDVGFSEPVEFPSDYDLEVPTYTGEPTYDPNAPHCYLNGIPTECGQALRLISQGMASVDPARTDRWGAGRLGL